MFSKGFSLTEIMIAVTLMTVVIVAVTSVDITSRQFFGSTERQSQIQDEAKFALEHIAKNVQLGIGDMSNPEALGSPPTNSNTRGFYILDSTGDLAASGLRLQVKRDGFTGPGDGRFDSSDAVDTIIEYEYLPAQDIIRYYPDKDDRNTYEDIAKYILDPHELDSGDPYIFESSIPNQVDVTIKVLRDPSEPKSLENPETILTSSIVLRAMSCN